MMAALSDNFNFSITLMLSIYCLFPFTSDILLVCRIKRYMRQKENLGNSPQCHVVGFGVPSLSYFFPLSSESSYVCFRYNVQGFQLFLGEVSSQKKLECRIWNQM